MCRTSKYRADSFSTRKCPLDGQYAGGTPESVDCGSCSMTRYCCMRSRLHGSFSAQLKRLYMQRHTCSLQFERIIYYWSGSRLKLLTFYLEVVQDSDPPNNHTTEAH